MHAMKDNKPESKHEREEAQRPQRTFPVNLESTGAHTPAIFQIHLVNERRSSTLDLMNPRRASLRAEPMSPFDESIMLPS